jgi:hypothetical protein
VPDAPPAPLLGSTGTTTFIIAALLVALGVAMIVTAVWLVRATRTDVRALGPLEVMGDRRWYRADPERRTRSLDAARPPGAPAPAPMLDADPEPAPASEPGPTPAPDVVEHAEPGEPEPERAEQAEPEPASTAHSPEEAEDPQPAETA